MPTDKNIQPDPKQPNDDDDTQDRSLIDLMGLLAGGLDSALDDIDEPSFEDLADLEDLDDMDDLD